MARCGCTGSCNCAVVNGSGIVVSGSGSATDPYVIDNTAQFAAPSTFVPGAFLTSGGAADSPMSWTPVPVIAGNGSSTSLALTYANNGAGNASAPGSQSIALGWGAAAGSSAGTGKNYAVGVGAGASALGDSSVAVGHGANAAYDNSVAIGNGASTAAAYEIALGVAANNVRVRGSLQIDGGISGSGVASDASVVHLANPETISGLKTFSAAPVLNAGASTGASTRLTMGGAFQFADRGSSTSAYTISTTGATLNPVDASGGAVTVTLPGSTSAGIVYAIKKTDSSANAVTITAAAGGLIDASLTYVLTRQYDTVWIQTTATTNVFRVLAFYRASTGVTAQSYGSSTAIPNFTVDAAGRVTAAGSTAISLTGIAAGGDLSGTYPNPAVAKINGVSVSGTPVSGNVIIASSGSTAAWGNLSITGQYLGSAATFTGLPTTDASGAAAGNGDWAILTADVVGTGTAAAPQYPRGVYVYSGTAYSLAASMGPEFSAVGGDLTGSLPNPTLATIGSGGTVSGPSVTPAISIDAKGRVISLGQYNIQITESQVTGLTTDLGAKATDSQVVHNVNNETVAGVKTFSSAPIMAAGLTSNAGQRLQSLGSLTVSEPAATITANTLLTTTTPMVNPVDATAGAVTITLPSNAGAGLLFVIKKTDASANVVTIAATSLDGAASYALNAQNDTVWVESTATSGTWRVLARYTTSTVDPNAVTLATTQTLTGAKTFTGGLAVPSGPFSLGFASQGAGTANVTLTMASPAFQVASCSAASRTIFLPAAPIANAGTIFVIKKVDTTANALVIDAATNGGTIENSTTPLKLTSWGETVTLMSTNAAVGDWRVIASSRPANSAYGFLGEASSASSVTLNALGTQFAGLAQVTFTLPVQRRVRITVAGRYLLGATPTTGRMVMQAVYSPGATASIATAVVPNAAGFSTVFNNSGTAGANGSTSTTNVATALLAAGTYTAYAAVNRNSQSPGGSNDDTANAWYTLVEDIGAV